MPTGQRKVQRPIVKRLLKQGVILGLIAAGVGLSLGYFRGGQTLKAAYEGLNWASLGMFLLSGVFIAGQIRQDPLDPVVRLTGADKVPLEPVPWKRIVVCVLAGAVCAALVFVLPLFAR